MENNEIMDEMETVEELDPVEQTGPDVQNEELDSVDPSDDTSVLDSDEGVFVDEIVILWTEEDTQHVKEQLLELNTKLDFIVESQTVASKSIWEKTLSEYNALEGMFLVLLFSVLAAIVFKTIGGIVKCKM